MKDYTRREFIKTGAALGAGAMAFTIVPSHVLGKALGHVAPSDKLNIAGIGIGGVGRRNLANMATENIVALCDVDWAYAQKTFGDYPSAKRFKDWRVMFDEMGKDIDAVLVATPDHTHAVIAAQEPTLNPALLPDALRQLAPALAPDFAKFTRIENYLADMRVFR